jgi:HK97 gp10 family phage protein
MEINLAGMDDILKQFYSIGRKSEEVEARALRAGAKVLKAEMEARAPREARDGYHLAEDIIIKKEDDGVYAVGPSKKGFYQHIVEFGSSEQAPQPFAGPAFESKKGEIERQMLQEIKKELGL